MHISSEPVGELALPVALQESLLLRSTLTHQLNESDCIQHEPSCSDAADSFVRNATIVPDYVTPGHHIDRLCVIMKVHEIALVADFLWNWQSSNLSLEFELVVV